VLGEAWTAQAAEQLAHAPPGLVQPLVERLRGTGQEATLSAQYAALLARPLRAPFALIALARWAEERATSAALLTPFQRASALLELAIHLEEAKRGNSQMARAHQRLTDLLTKGPEPLLRRLLSASDAAELRGLRSVLQRGIDDRIDTLLTEIALERGLDLFRAEAMPFWRENRVWTTRAGLARRDAELREIREVKLPQNAEAIGRAAGYGDLSENFEWAQAIEEQRQLTTAASTIEQELRLASLLENALIPEGLAAPGTHVTYRELDSGAVHKVTVLGPWDEGEGVVSYRAPLAAGMLGLRPGQTAQIELPSGSLAVEVLEVHPVGTL
jgi:transcription elongation factor GreA